MHVLNVHKTENLIGYAFSQRAVMTDQCDCFAIYPPTQLVVRRGVGNWMMPEGIHHKSTADSRKTVGTARRYDTA